VKERDSASRKKQSLGKEEEELRCEAREALSRNECCNLERGISERNKKKYECEEEAVDRY